MNAEKRNFTFVVLLDEDTEDFYSYDAYSLSQALYLLSLDGFSESDNLSCINTFVARKKNFLCAFFFIGNYMR